MFVTNKLQKIIFILLSFAYLLIFIPPNLTGAKDINMISIFEMSKLGGPTIDEYAEFPPVIAMTTLGSSIYETLKNIVFYNYFFYGYPFFLVSSIAILPLRMISHFAHDINLTTAYMLVLRQLSPLFITIAILLIIYLWTEFKDLTRGVFLFVFLGSIPLLVWNNMWWHPDSLAILFIVLTIFSLCRDELRFGKWFYLAAIFCGLATGTKLIGLYFFLTIPTYILLGLLNKRIQFKASISHGIAFCLVMFSTVIITNPLLLLPGTRAAYLANLNFVTDALASGWEIKMVRSPWGWYTEVLRESYGLWWIFAITLCVSLLGIIYDRKKRLLNIIILTWALPFSLFLLFFAARKPPLYFLPIMLPMMSCLGNPILWNLKQHYKRGQKAIIVTSIMFLFLCGLQLTYYIESDIDLYIERINREKTSPSIAFYRKLEQSYLSKLPKNVNFTVFRDPYIYIPPSKNLNIKMNWGNTNYSNINSIHPDIILLQRAYIEKYLDPMWMSIVLNKKKSQSNYEFYKDAKNNSIKGFTKILETEFGLAFARK